MQAGTWSQRRQEALQRIEAQRAERESIDVVAEWAKLTEQIPKYQYREKFPEPVLHYADWFVKATNIEPNERTYKAWIKELVYWQDNQLDAIDLENAWNKSGEGSQFMVTSPMSLSNVAIAMKARNAHRQVKYSESKSAYACPRCGRITCECE